MVEVEVGDYDRVHPRPALLLAEAGEHPGPAVEEDASRALDEVPGLCPARIRPGGRAPDNRELHLLSVA